MSDDGIASDGRFEVPAVPPEWESHLVEITIQITVPSGQVLSTTLPTLAEMAGQEEHFKPGMMMRVRMRVSTIV